MKHWGNRCLHCRFHTLKTRSMGQAIRRPSSGSQTGCLTHLSSTMVPRSLSLIKAEGVQLLKGQNDIWKPLCDELFANNYVMFPSTASGNSCTHVSRPAHAAEGYCAPYAAHLKEIQRMRAAGGSTWCQPTEIPPRHSFFSHATRLCLSRADTAVTSFLSVRLDTLSGC